MPKRVLCLFVIFAMMASCGGVRQEMLNGELTRAEDLRNPAQLMSVVKTMAPSDIDVAVHAALASGRVSSFASWQVLAERFGKNPKVAKALAIATRFPENHFPGDLVLKTLQKLPIGEDSIISMLALDTPAAFRAALSYPDFDRTVAANLWRARNVVVAGDVESAYRVYPAEAVYSVYRLKLKGIVTAKALKSMGVFQKVYGCAVCDAPGEFLADPDWRVRVAALRAVNSRKGVVTLLDDENPLVRATALEIYLKNGGTVWRKAKQPMSPMEVETLLRTSDKAELAPGFFDKGGVMAEVSAPFMPKLKKKEVLASAIPDFRKIAYLDHRLGEDVALQWAESRFHESGSPAALQYLLEKLPDVGKPPFVAEAREKGGALLSVLDDFGFREKSEEAQPLAVYLNVLKKAKELRGFTLKTEKGDIHCEFFPEAAPLTCLNFAKLAGKGYFNGSRFHRVVPAFVAQAGDPTGTGSGGPGYSIRCEYNGINYDRAGRVGMALSGKDTGGSQFFLTHLATPHLNQKYTVFAQLTSGLEVLSELEQLDEIKEVTVDKATGAH